MVAITATNSSTPSVQAALGRVKLALAQREASQAEDNAKQLRAQADKAEQQAQQSQTKVAQTAASNTRRGDTYTEPTRRRSTEVPVKVQNFIENLYRSTSPQRDASGNALKTNANEPPVINGLGQATGRILNLSV